MGFFDKILKGLGFEDEEPTVQKEPKVKVKKTKKPNSVTASYNLNDLEKEQVKEKEQTIKENETVEESTNETTDFEVVKVISQEQVQMVVNKLKVGKKVLLNIENLSGNDITRSLDFITGAIYALNLKMQKLDEKLYLIQ